MRFTVLGPMTVVRDTQAVVLGGPRQRSVLAVLLVAANRVVPVDRLIDEVWGGSSSPETRDSLHVYVSNLRRVLGADRLERVAEGYRLNIEPGELDAEQFGSEADQARVLLHSDPHRAKEVLSQALDRWEGDPYQGIDCPSVASEAAHLTERHLAAVEDFLETRVALGQHREVIPDLRSFCEKHPLRERMWGSWMLALYRDGRQAEALGVYRRLHTQLGEELGIEPSSELRRLEERILLQDSGLDLEPRIPHNLPAPLNSFVGRQRELVEVGKLLTEARLVTLTGVGGSGKTRLGLELARIALADHPDGVWQVDLGRIRDPAVVPRSISQTLNIPLPQEQGAVRALCDGLRNRKTLIMLDGFDHVIEAAGLVASLLEAAPDLRVLVTSRERLRLSGEQLYHVLPLELSDATSLFVERVKAVRADFHLDEDDAHHAATICEYLDGLPLSIELAAAQADGSSLAVLRKQLNSRLATLTGGPRDRPSRQESLRDTIDWSYRLLSPDQQIIFGSMGVFHGGCTVAAVEAVCRPRMSQDDVRDGLQALANKSLILRRTGPDGTPRFSMLDTIHEYARELFDREFDTKTVRKAHCDYYVEHLERAGTELRWGDSGTGWETLNADADNHRAALEWAFTDGDRIQGARLLGLCHFWEENEAWGELERWEDEALEHADALEPLARARLLFTVAHSHHGHRSPRALCQEALTWANVSGDRLAIAQAKFNLAWTYAGDRSNHERAVSMCRQAVEETRSAEVPGLTAHALTTLGELLRSHGDDEAAKRSYEEALHIAREVHNRTLTTVLLLNLAFIAGHQADYSTAERCATQALIDAQELADQTLMAWSLGGVAVAATAAGRSRRAARLLGAAEQAYLVLGIKPDPADRPEYDQARTRLVELLDPADLQALLAEGHAMTNSDAVAYAIDGSLD